MNEPLDRYWPNRALIAFRIVQWSILIALVWKLGAFIQMLKVYLAMPLHHSFFPSWLQSPWTVLVAYVTTVGGLFVTALSGTRHPRWVAAVLVWCCVTVLCIHQGSYNDMTFATAWWASVWSVWLATRLDLDEDTPLIRRAAFASRCIASMVLLGGAVGKWTDEYWSGQVLYEIYYLDRDFWFFNLQRQMLDGELLRVAATWYSRMVVIVESGCGLLLWLMPPRIAGMTAVIVFTSIALFSNFYLFSVLLSMVGLAAVGLFVPTRLSNRTEPTEESVSLDSHTSP